MSLLSDDQVNKFLVEKLKFSHWKSALNNKKEFLRELVRLAGIHTHYENVTWGGQDPTEWRAPTVEDVVRQEMETGGGACIHQNYILKLILDHLGFDAFAVAADVCNPPVLVPCNHAMTVVRLNTVESGEELYLIDTGFGGRPFTEPVNLSKLPYVARAGGYDFEYRFNEELQRYERIAHFGNSITGALEDGIPSVIECSFQLKPEEFENFQKTFHKIFTDPTLTFFLNTNLIARFTSLNSPTDFEFVTFRGKVLVTATAETRKEENFVSYQAMQSKIEELFPALDPKRLAAALYRYDNKKKATQ